MSSTQTKQMFEGVGAPVNVAKTDGYIDPTLDSCCQREIESNRKRSAVETALRSHDRVAQAEDQRRQYQQPSLPIGGGGGINYNEYNLLPLSFGNGCRCCYDPNADGGEYDLLAEARKERAYDDAAAAADDDIAGGGTVAKDNVRGAAAANDELNGSDHSDSDDSEFDYLLDEDIPASGGGNSAALVNYQSQRRTELENMARHHEVARYHGYGVHRQMHPSRVFAAAGYGSDRVRDRIPPKGSVLHLYDAYSPLSVSLDLCLEDMTKRYAGTKFVRGIGVTSMLHAEDEGDAEWKRRGDLPMLLALRDGRVIAFSSGLRDFCKGCLGSGEEVESDAVERWLDRAGALHTAPPSLDVLCRIRPEEEMLLENMRKLNGLGGSIRPPPGMKNGMFCGEIGQKNVESMEDEEEAKRYDCGIDGCNKCFFHEHVGVKNEAQDGLLVSESDVAS